MRLGAGPFPGTGSGNLGKHARPGRARGRALGSDCDPGCLEVGGSSPSRALDLGEEARGLGTAADRCPSPQAEPQERGRPSSDHK